MASISQEQSPYISRIPIEIFAEILSHMEPVLKLESNISDLIPDATSHIYCAIRGLSLVCRHFYRLLYPMRFRTVFAVNDRGDESKYKLLHSRRFCRAIVGGNVRARALAAYVQRFAIGRFDLTTAGRLLVEEELSVISEALSLMSNLRELHLFRTSITNGLLNAVLSLPPLKILRLDNCNVPHELDKMLLRQFSTLRAAHIYTGGPFFGKSECATDQFFGALCMSYTKVLTCKPGTSFRLLKGLASLGQMKHLTKIHIEGLHLDEHRKLLSDVLFATPVLRHLHVAEITHGDSGDGAFQPYSQFPKLPHLEYIHAHMPALEALIPGSRVSIVGVASEKLGIIPLHYPGGLECWQNLGALMKKSQRRIEDLDVPVLFYTNISCENYFPDLLHLTLRMQHPNWVHDPSFYFREKNCDKVANMIMDSWPEHPDLDDLEIVFRESPWPMDLSLNHWTLLDLKGVFPHLSCLLLTCARTNKRKRYTWSNDNSEPQASEAANMLNSS